MKPFTPSFIRPAKPHRRGRLLQDHPDPTFGEEDRTRALRTADRKLRFETTDEERQARIRMPTLKFLSNPEAKP